MITGAHIVLYSTDAGADRAFLRDVLGLEHVDAGEGWLIFRLPPSEVAVHPAHEHGAAELYLTCADVEAFVADMARREVACTPIRDRGWGRLTELALPGGGTLGVYEPRHPRPGDVAEPRVLAPEEAPAGKLHIGRGPNHAVCLLDSEQVPFETPPGITNCPRCGRMITS